MFWAAAGDTCGPFMMIDHIHYMLFRFGRDEDDGDGDGGGDHNSDV